MSSSSTERGAFTFGSNCSIPAYDISVRYGADTQIKYVADEGAMLELQMDPGRALSSQLRSTECSANLSTPVCTIGSLAPYFAVISLPLTRSAAPSLQRVDAKIRAFDQLHPRGRSHLAKMLSSSSGSKRNMGMQYEYGDPSSYIALPKIGAPPHPFLVNSENDGKRRKASIM
ncbi:hypothetical protein ARMGADRAFT_1038533 [Armillaria gallica]|uniref:Uncharacterized protein n=1 Tax=Armillaria gallica TaxID=47427 RepID=A0A2H3CTK1_ARMGA|nr:hypothetical protein ARMGADRAFT_1038533 [Armillaria gallica]